MAVNLERRTGERIIEAATALFYDKGYHAATMREIAARVDIKAGSLYNHFASKQDLLMHISLGTTEDLYAGALERLAGIGDAGRRLEAFVRWHVAFHARERLAARVTDEHLHALEPENRDRVLLARDAHEQLLREILLDGQRNHGWKVEDPAVIAFAILTMCTQVDAWYREDGRLSPEEIGEMFGRFILTGLGVDR